jgi:plasmid stabilization system protein ParE
MKICGLACEVFPVGDYIIIYRIEDTDVLILHVMRGSRHIEALFRN